MRTRVGVAMLVIASLIGMLAVAFARAAPTRVNVRIEGESETLFEGPIWTEGHDVEASSDTKQRPCDGIDPLDPQNKTPGPTPTGASVDAMSLIGETFDGQWYPGYGDYFVTRWGPDREEEGMSWGILVNNVFTDVGGCQYELTSDNEVLWAYDAFGHKPFLALFSVAGGYTAGARPLTATAELNKPFEVEVVGYDDDAEDEPPATSERTGSSPYEGAAVSPVRTSAKGFEEVETESPETVTTGSNGMASITFTEPGWHRIKATAVNGKGEEDAIRSNRLDVCVPAEGESGCGEPPAEDQVRTPLYIEEERKREEEAKVQEEATHQGEVTRQKEVAQEEVKLREELEEEAKLREEEAKRLDGEAKPSLWSEPKSENAGGQASGIAIAMPLITADPIGLGTASGRKRTVVKGRKGARCVHGRTAARRSAPPKCKKTTAARHPKPKPKRRSKRRRRDS
jgi:hypothetical protein